MYNLLTLASCLCGKDYLHRGAGSVTGLQEESGEGGVCSQIASPVAK